MATGFTRYYKTLVSKPDPSLSPPSDNLQDLASQIRVFAEQMNQELEEQGRDLEEIATRVEVAQETNSLARSRITTLLEAANRLSTNPLTGLQRYSSELDQGLFVNQLEAAEADLAGQVAPERVAPEPWRPDQG